MAVVKENAFTISGSESLINENLDNLTITVSGYYGDDEDQGALYYYYDGSGHSVTNCVIQGGDFPNYAVAVDSCGSLTIDSVEFINLRNLDDDDDSAGALYIEGKNNRIENSVFSGNFSDGSAGAIFIDDDADEKGIDAVVTIKNTRFETVTDTITCEGRITISGDVSFAGNVVMRKGSELVNNGNIIFDLAPRKTSDGALISDWSTVKGDGDLQINVESEMMLGAYTLALNCKSFSGSFTVSNGDIEYGEISLDGSSLEAGDYIYSLSKNKNSLVLNVADVKSARDDWADMKLKGSAGTVDRDTIGDIDMADKGNIIVKDGYVGVSDIADYMQFTLATAANLSFSVYATDAVKVTVYQLTGTSGNYKLTGKKNISVAAGKTAELSGLLLDAGSDYYICVESTNAAKGGNASYDITVNKNSIFYTESNDKDNDVFAGANFFGTLSNESRALSKTGWVGYGDKTDYWQFGLETAANLVFTVHDTADAVSVNVYQLDAKGKLVSKKKVAVAAGKTAELSGLLLEAGDDYYISVESTNAAKGGNASYTITVDDQKSVFYTGSSDKDNDVFAGADFFGTLSNENRALSKTGWVGYGDKTDYWQFGLETAANLVFTVHDTADAVSVNVYQLDAKGKLVSKKKVAVAAGKTAELSGLLLEAGDDYYISVESTNAAKGGNASYTITVDDQKSVFYTGSSDKDNNAFAGADFFGTISKASGALSKTGWVGYGDAIDYLKLDVANTMDICFSVNTTDSITVTVYEMVKGKLVKKQNASFASGSGSSKAFTVNRDGEYYLEVTSKNAAKGGNAEYEITVAKYVKPVVLTITGLSSGDFVDSECEFEHGWCDCGCDDDWTVHYNNLTSKAKCGVIEGDKGNDVITFAANKGVYFEKIDLGDGNDQIILKDSKSGEALLYGGYLGSIINMGSGNDSIYIGVNYELEASSIYMGDGNDTITLGAGAELELSWSEDGLIDFGAGNDKLITTAGEDGEIEDVTYIEFGEGNDEAVIASGVTLRTGWLDFGADDDKLVIDKGGSVYAMGDLEFGEGVDELVVNGCLKLENYYDFSDVEKISGSGSIVFGDFCGEENLAALKDKLSNTDIKIYQAANLDNFSSPAAELGDNKINGAHVNVLSSSEYDELDFWLCSEDAAKDLGTYGFADEVDYIQFVKNTNCFGIYLNSNGGDDILTIEVLDSKGNLMADYSIDNYMYNDVSKWKNGTYYIKLSVASGAQVSGSIHLDDY